MATSLQEQLQRLRAPQTSIFVDTNKRESILFDWKEAAEKDRKTIFEIGYEGLMQLVTINPVFLQFECTLFDRSSLELERSVEDSEVNRILDKNIKRFFHYLAPYFMLEPAHMCLEWLVRRFRVHHFNKKDFIALIIAYHETMIFVKCVQIIDLKNPQDPWRWLASIQKPGVPLAKSAILSRAASDNFFLEFVCLTTVDAVKELGTEAHLLQAHINFYCITAIGAMEYLTEITESFITSVLPSVLKGFGSSVIDFTSAAFMITAQLVSKTQLGAVLLNALVDKICSVARPKMQNDVLLLVVLIYQKQGNELRTFPEKTLLKFISYNWVPSGLAALAAQSVAVSALCAPLMGSCLRRVQTKDEGWSSCKSFLENLLTKIHFVGDEAKQLIRTTLDNYHRHEPLKKDEIIEISSDDEDIMLDEDVQRWYSSFLQSLERQYPAEFDSTIKETLQEQHSVSEARRQALKTVLAYRLKSSYSEDNTAIYENLYHHNAKNRVQAIKHLIKSLGELNLSQQSEDLLKDSLIDRLNDDNPKVVNEILKVSTKLLVNVIGIKAAAESLVDVLSRSHVHKENWTKVASNAIKHITSPEIFKQLDKNCIFIALFPFLISSLEEDIVHIQEILTSEFAKVCPFLSAIKLQVQNEKDYQHIFLNVKKAMVSAKNLPSVKNVVESVKNAGARFLEKSSNYTGFIFTLSTCCTPGLDPAIGLEVLEYLQNYQKSFEFVHLSKDEHWISTIRENKIPLEVFRTLLEVLAKKSNFGELEDFSCASPSSLTLFLQIYENLLTNAFTASKPEKIDYGNSFQMVLNTVFPTSEKKLSFLSNFFVPVCSPNTSISPATQIRSIKMFDLVLNGSDQNFTISWNVFIKILLALTSKFQVIRECSLRTLQSLLQCRRINEDILFVSKQILERSEEILMDQEQFPLVLFTIISTNRTTKTETNQEKAFASQCLANFIKFATDGQVPDYLKVGVLQMLKHINSTAIFKKLHKTGLDVLQYIEEATVQSKDEEFCLDDLKSEIMKLIIVRFEEDTIKIVGQCPEAWTLIEKTLKLHNILVRNNGKLESLACSTIEAFTESLYEKLPLKYKEKFIRLVVEAVTFANGNSLPSAGSKLMRRINLDGSHGIGILEEMKSLCCPSTGKRRTSKAIAPDSETLNCPQWRCGITFLEFVQNKKKLEGYQCLMPVLFELLKKCLEFEEQSTLEYVKQLTLSCILHFCQKMNTEPDRAKQNIQDSVFKTDLVVQCIRATENLQTHHHALLLLSHLSLMIPHQVLHNMMDIFTFMGSSLVRHDDAFSFQIISNIVESVVPTLVQAHSSGKPDGDEKAVVPVLKVFADIALDVPEHRRLPLYTKLIRTLGPAQFLWMFLCLLFESHVIHDEQDKTNRVKKRLPFNMEELPKRVEIALQLIKDFDPYIELQTCTSLLNYLQNLPLDKIDDKERMEVDITDTTLFDVNSHSSKQLRHYKYIILQFISSFTSSTDFMNQIALLSEEQTKGMKPIYQNFIIKILSYIPHVTNAMEKNSDNNQAKFWKVILHHCYDVLESAISLLSPDMLLIVVHGLLQHQLAAVRKKVIDILNKKLQYNADFFVNCNEENFLNLLKPLNDIVNSILTKEKIVKNASSTDIVCIQQLALMTIKLLSKLLALKYVDEFKDILHNLSRILRKRSSTSNVILATVVLAITEISSNLKAHSIAYLSKFMPHIIDILQEQSEAVLLTQAPDNICLAIVAGVQKLFETLPLFLGPYIVDLLFSLCLLWVKVLPYQEEEPRAGVVIGKLMSIWNKIATSIPLRVLVPNCHKAYKKLIEQWQFKGIKFLMRLLAEAFKHANANDIQSLQSELTVMFLLVLDLRNELVDYEDQYEVTSTENDVLQAFVVHILKLSESYFRPLYQKVYEWAMKDTTTQHRAITYFLLSSKIAESLKSLFVLFASDFIQDAANLLDKCNSSKTKDICFSKFEKRRTLLIENILQTLYQVFLYDSKGFINTHRFEILMQPIVDQLENPLVVDNKSLKELVIGCLSQLAVAVSNDTLWKQLNYQILLKTRSNNPEHRIIAFMCCVEIARKLGENFSPLLPETIPFVAELLEDENEKVEKSCRKGIQEMEKILGESLQNYF